MNPNFVDKIYQYFSPELFNKRISARAKYSIYEKRYLEAGSKSKRMSKKFSRKTSDINEDIDIFLETIVQRTQFLDDNMPYARRASSIWTNFVVGNGIRPDFHHKNTTVSSIYEETWNNWAESTQCDFYGQMNLYGLMTLAFKTMFISGSCFVTKSIEPDREFPLVLKLFSSNDLDKSKRDNGLNKVRQGIEFDSLGRKVAIWTKPTNPKQKSKRISSQDVLHVFEVLRPGQITGIPKLTPSVVRISEYDDFTDASLVKQKIAACLVGAVHDMNSDDPLPGNESQNEDSDLPSTFTPGMWTVLPTGKTVSFNNPPSVEGVDEFETVQLRAIASGSDLPFEILANNYTRMNFSSSRMSLGTFFQISEPLRNNQFIPQFCNGVMRWFYEICLLKNLPNGISNSWSEMVKIYPDPYKEAMANKINVLELQIDSRTNLIRAKGKDPDKVFSQLKSELKHIKNLVPKEENDATDAKIENAVQAIQERIELLTGDN